MYTTNQAYQTGRWAREAGRSPASCPMYAMGEEGIVLREAWRKGWADQDREIREVKPDWKDAPEWANWLAMDRCGDWYWYREIPTKCDGSWVGGVLAERVMIEVEWEESLEGRP